ncbi:TonB-dependent receptor [Tamlana sp. 2_MG-2023]|uniref:TonB-dependent receptor family protein n=1 Tax=unclassified Tamlana TaxID=2614803 RepID=UPI0026E1744A|nr:MULTISPECIES: TonB-dependent receptor [unclassified Tamlana]MDO6760220.1 TonB-dependent receptor [Tamlana sp. 2_MG-2023]MDO6790082.1 TonB-dependent receptor [Tamlana sp. 1_MG-2023]
MRITLLKMVVILSVILWNHTLIAQQISGLVKNEAGEGVANVTLSIDSKIITKTDDFGAFILADSLNFPIRLVLKHPNYEVKTVSVTVSNVVVQLVSLENREQLNTVVISSNFQKESQVIIPTTKVSSKNIEAYSPVNLVSALNETPGVYIQSGALNTNRIVIRGVGSRTLYGTNKIRAYFNGIPITNGAGETSIDAFDPEDIANIEVVKGPKATPYGSNLGGTLLLNTKQAAVGETRFSNSFTMGSFGLIKNRITFGTAEEKFAVHLNYDHLESDGFRDNSAYRRDAVLLNTNYKFDEKNELGFLINYTNYFAQIASSIGQSDFEEDPSQAAYTWGAAQGYEDNDQILIGLNYTHRFTNRFSNTTSVFYSYLDHYEPRPFNILDEYTNGYGARTLFVQDFDFLDDISSLSFGAELYADEYHWKTLENLYESQPGNGSIEGDLLSDNLEKRNSLNVFATTTLVLTEALKVQLGLNMNKTSFSFLDYYHDGNENTSADRDFDPILAPNVNVLYQFTPNLEVYANFSRGYNFPSIEETLTPEGVINPDLGPETGYNYELGSEFYAFQKRLRMQVSAYLLDIDNLLVADRVGEDQYIGRNAGKTEHKGVELAVFYTQEFNYSFMLRPYMNAEITDHRFIDFVDGNSDYSGNELTGVPDHKVNGGLQFGLKHFSFDTNMLYVGDMPMNDANTLYSDPYTVFNAKLAYKNELSEHLSIEVNAGINNFTNETYAASILINAVGFGNSEPRYYYPGAPRNWFGGFKLRYDM